MSLAVEKVASANDAEEINTLVDLLEALSDQLDRLQNDEVDPATANAVYKKAGAIIRSARLGLWILAEGQRMRTPASQCQTSGRFKKYDEPKYPKK